VLNRQTILRTDQFESASSMLEIRPAGNGTKWLATDPWMRRSSARGSIRQEHASRKRVPDLDLRSMHLRTTTFRQPNALIINRIKSA
jgi:hypothetical protein